MLVFQIRSYFSLVSSWGYTCFSWIFQLPCCPPHHWLKRACLLHHTTWVSSFLIIVFVEILLGTDFLLGMMLANSMLFNCILGHVLCFLRPRVFPIYFGFVLPCSRSFFFFFNFLEYFFKKEYVEDACQQSIQKCAFHFDTQDIP